MVRKYSFFEVIVMPIEPHFLSPYQKKSVWLYNNQKEAILKMRSAMMWNENQIILNKIMVYCTPDFPRDRELGRVRIMKKMFL